MSDHCRGGFQFGLVCLIMAALTGLAGFFIVYHYATFERPIQHYAIVIDAGSTQTRSNLFKIGFDLPKLIEWTDANDDSNTDESADELKYGLKDGQSLPLTRLFQVKQVSSCVNGGPLASIQSEKEATKLVKKCVTKFANQIKRLDFSAETNNLKIGEEEEDFSLETENSEEKLAIESHRVNSLTNLYLGATAGVRALGELNETKANEKVQWIDKAINQSNELIGKTITNAPYINKGFVGILPGTDEATFGWISVNFVCDRLAVPRTSASSSLESLAISGPKYNLINNKKNREPENNDHEFDDDDNDDKKSRRIEKILQQSTADATNSVGTLELGGASSQIAYRVPNWLKSEQVANMSLREQNLDLFNEKYKLATRSDLCLGMSQAILRVEYILMRDSFRKSHFNALISNSTITTLHNDDNNNNDDELENPCMQKGSHKSLNSVQLEDQLGVACLVESRYDRYYKNFRNYTKSKGVGVKFRGTGNAMACAQLLKILLEPQSCMQYFSICPHVDREPTKINNNTPPLAQQHKPRPQPPGTMPFVTISGYNKALQALDLQKIVQTNSSEQQRKTNELNQVIASRLGGYSINYTEFTTKTRDFCQVDISELPLKYPKIHKAFHAITCLQLVYIEKLLTEFYQFNPKTSWNQIKFLIFPVDSSSSSLSFSSPSNQFSETDTNTELSHETKKVKKKHEFKNDIGWTLGLLLNATSNQYGGESKDNNFNDSVFHHHKSSVMFVMTSTLFLMLAAFAMAISVIVVAIFAVRHQQRRGNSYIVHHSSSSEGNQDV